MEHFFGNGILFGEETLNSIHIFAGSWLDYFMVGVTKLGNQMFYTLMLPVLYWTVKKTRAVKLGIIFLLTASLNDIIKEIFQNPRPDPALLSQGIKELALKYSLQSPGFPSGHTQCTVAFFGSIFVLFKSLPIRALSAALIILVPYSRLYLGVHHAGDVLGGYIFGGLIFLLLPFLAYMEKNYKNFNEIILYVLITAASVMMFTLTPNYEVSKTAGVLAGFLTGSIMAAGRINFSPEGTFRAALVKCAIGLIVLLAIKSEIKIFLPDSIFSDYARYWLMGFWVTYWAPLLFSRFSMLKGKEA